MLVYSARCSYCGYKVEDDNVGTLPDNCPKCCHNGHKKDEYTCPECGGCIACVDEGYRESGGCSTCELPEKLPMGKIRKSKKRK